MRSISALWIPCSLLLLLAASWFTLMELLMGQPGFEVRAAVAALIVIYATLCLRYGRGRDASLRWMLVGAAVAALGLGIYGMVADLQASHFEGYVLLLAAGLILHALLTLTQTLPPAGALYGGGSMPVRHGAGASEKTM